MAPISKTATATESFLRGQVWSQEVFEKAYDVVRKVSVRVLVCCIHGTVSTAHGYVLVFRTSWSSNTCRFPTVASSLFSVWMLFCLCNMNRDFGLSSWSYLVARAVKILPSVSGCALSCASQMNPRGQVEFELLDV